MPKHILVISQYFYPEPFRIDDICSELVKRGYQVTVLTGVPNYPEGKFYSGYGWFKRTKESWNGVEVIRIPLIPRGNSSLGLVFNYFSFVISGFMWRLVTRVKADCVFTFGLSPMTQALIGVWYAKKRKIPHYLYVQDLWPESVEIVTGIHSKLVITPLRKMVNYIYRNCDKILGTSPSFVKEIQLHVTDNKEKVLYWPQYAEAFYCPQERKALPEIPDDGRFKVIFTGNIGQAQGLDILPQTAKILKEQARTDVQFVLVGNGRYRENLLEQIRESDAEEMFTIIERQPAHRIPELLAACDVAFLSFLDDALLEKTIPAKLQSYMACGMPIVASVKGEAARVIQEADCGICCQVGDSEGLAKGILSLMNEGDLQTKAKNARSYFETYFEKQKLMGHLEREVLFTEETVGNIKI